MQPSNDRENTRDTVDAGNVAGTAPASSQFLRSSLGMEVGTPIVGPTGAV